MSVNEMFLERTEYAVDIFEASEEFRELRNQFNNYLLELESICGEKHRKTFLNFEEIIQLVAMEKIRIAYSVGYKDAKEGHIENTYSNHIKHITKNYSDTLIFTNTKNDRLKD